eukprot:CAMPEP_0174702378 /NCGR_PEP_ID=MMETSP1094-20130205/6684_1 /TAXON_ID=156173 /ORGANISM="Chrysochromulina brevifilum, Strain UTEX LB 985" /LENGTH=81 /DNA_ID=CAMNT_0015900147 /DNA_START=1511 /DNA_END=1757 /DNA_ORIENTATION=+
MLWPLASVVPRVQRLGVLAAQAVGEYELHSRLLMAVEDGGRPRVFGEGLVHRLDRKVESVCHKARTHGDVGFAFFTWRFDL